MDKKRILIVDDLYSIVETTPELIEFFLGNFFSASGIATTSIDEAITAIKNYKPDIILLDHELTIGGNEGLEIAKIINTSSLKSETVVISTSTLVNSSWELTEEYRKNGVRHFSGKNFDEIKKCLEHKCNCFSSN